MKQISPAQLKSWVADGEELAAIDIRKLGPFTRGHLWFAIHLPFARLELQIQRFVPRLSTRIVLFDDGDGLAERAADVLSDMGYSSIHSIAGGVDQCRSDGLDLVDGNYCVQHAFGFFLIDQFDIPLIKADRLKAQIDRDEKPVIIDSRPATEYKSSTVPSAINIPAAEVLASAGKVVPDTDSEIIFHCGGITRGVLGAHALLAGGSENRISVLNHGTKGWLAHGFDVVAGHITEAGGTASSGVSKMEEIAHRYRLTYTSADDLEGMQADESRTTYLVDVRPPLDYVANHAVGALSIPGEELAGMTNDNLATRNARLCLIGDPKTGNAEITASWMKHLGWEVVILKGWAATLPLESGPEPSSLIDADKQSEAFSADDLDVVATIPKEVKGDALLEAHADYNIWRESLYPRFQEQNDIKFYTLDEIVAGSS